MSPNLIITHYADKFRSAQRLGISTPGTYIHTLLHKLQKGTASKKRNKPITCLPYDRWNKKILYLQWFILLFPVWILTCIIQKITTVLFVRTARRAPSSIVNFSGRTITIFREVRARRDTHALHTGGARHSRGGYDEDVLNAPLHTSPLIRVSDNERVVFYWSSCNDWVAGVNVFVCGCKCVLSSD